MSKKFKPGDRVYVLSYPRFVELNSDWTESKGMATVLNDFGDRCRIRVDNCRSPGTHIYRYEELVLESVYNSKLYRLLNDELE